jgi:alpha-glucosidase
MAPPVVVVLPKHAGYLAFTEGRLVNYPGMPLRADGKGNFVVRPGNEVPADKALIYFQGQATADRLAKPAAIQGPIMTPWRIAMISTDLNGLVNNDIVSDVADAPDPKLFPEGPNTAWIKPGRAVWRYMDGGPRGLEGAKAFSRMAGQLGFQYQILEGYWTRWSEAQLKDLADYSRTQGVGLWLWKNRRDLETRAKREAFFDMCNRTGVVGVKIDFFDSEAKSVIDLYQDILREAAQHHLLVNFHGSDKPTGEQRTWPNELTREAVEGMEYCCDKQLTPPPVPLHSTTLPFTRLLAGPADYTPVLFDRALHGTTWANQIASAVIITSPLLTYAANPKTILANPAVGLMRDIPSTWDETVVLPPSAIGKLAVFARRKGKKWFLAAMNGDDPHSFDVPLAFLGKGEWKAEAAGDVAGNPAAVKMRQGTYKSGGVIHVALGPGGGYVAEFTPE